MATARLVLKGRQDPDPAPLFIQASLSRTFRGLALFTLFGLICCGCYLLMDAISSPLEANQTAVLVSAAMLGLAIVLLFHMLSPFRRAALGKRSETGKRRNGPEEAPLTPFGNALQTRIEATHALQTRDDLPGPM
jgi:hypothetical protein